MAHRFIGNFNWNGEIHEFKTIRKCSSRPAAFMIFTGALAKKLSASGVAASKHSVRNYFDNNQGKYEIIPVKE